MDLIQVAGSPVATAPVRQHGGTDALGVPRFDFSTNSNACGPCPQALTAVQLADASSYPDACYTALRAQLAAFHGVDDWRVVLAGSASEFIFRITAWLAQGQGGAVPTRVWLPAHAYGDYAQAAQAWGCVRAGCVDAAQLLWACEPSSPLGGAHGDWPHWLREQPCPVPATLVLDCAYAPLRLSGTPTLAVTHMNCVWQLWTPNKALGLTGVRAAYAIAPLGARAGVDALNRLCPSWPVGAHGVALLHAWVQPAVQIWVAQSLDTLRSWKTRQIGLLQDLGWCCLPSEANFFCARPFAPGQEHHLPSALSGLRRRGIKLRDAASFGLRGHVRVGVLAPLAQDALAEAWRSIHPVEMQTP